MSKDINSVTMTGRLVKDAETSLHGESTLVTFDLASGYSVKKDGAWKDDTNFVRVKRWLKSTGVVQYLVKGAMVGVSGEIRQERWEKDGQKRSAIIIMADNLVLLGGKSSQSAPQVTTQDTPHVNDGPDDDSIPF